MNIEQLQYFIEVADSGSFSEAAERLFTTQSSVTKHIQALEKELCISLFDRSRRKICLTEAGELVLKDAKEMVDLHARMLHCIENYTHRSDQQLKIASIPVMAQYDITGLVAAFSDRHPDVHLSIQEIEGIDMISKLKNQEFDFAFMRIEHLDEGFVSVPICTDQLSVVLAANHPLAGRETIALEELSGEQFLLLNQWTLLYDICVQACQNAGFMPQVKYTGTRMDTILGLIGMNQGISLMMNYAASRIHQENICIIPLKEEIQSTVGLARLKNRHLSAAGKDFWKFVSARSEIK
jgi:DNA-binding transcriptional LysR family regulator